MTQTDSAFHLCFYKEMRRIYPRTRAFPCTDIVDGYEYRTSFENGAMVVSRQKTNTAGSCEIVLDSRWLGWGSRGKTVSKAVVSDDHNKIAFLQTRPQDEQGSLVIRTLNSNAPAMFTYSQSIPNVFNFVWANNSKTIYFTRLDDVLRSSKVYRIDVDSPHEETVVYSEMDILYFVDLARSKDKQHVFINVNSASTSEIHIIQDNSYCPSILISRDHQVQCYADAFKDSLFLLHNYASTELKLYRTSLSTVLTGKAINLESDTSIVAAPGYEESIDDVEIFPSHAVLTMKRQGQPFIRSIDLVNMLANDVFLSDSSGVISPEPNIDLTSNTFRFSYSSPFVIQAIYELNLVSGKLINWQDIRPCMDTNNFVIEKQTIPSRDGTCNIPITILKNKNISHSPSNPCVILVYGSYGYCIETSFRVELLPALSRGVTVVFAHVRGGGELGNSWYHKGRAENKLCSFTDLEDVADMLIYKKYTSSERLGGIGTSAGGMLLAGTANRRPDLFKALVLRVSFLDPLTTMLDPNSSLSAGEVLEWGNPLKDSAAYQLMSSYSPYDNLDGKLRTAVLATAGSDDQRVPPWHALKYIVRMHELAQHSGTASNGYFKLYADRGHNQGSGDNIDEHAFEYAFLLSKLGCK
ncbi:hypothetical protein MT418_008086 [Batrachochytrium dendrobatidis]